MDLPASTQGEDAPDLFGAMLSRTRLPGAGDGPLAGIRLCVKDNIAVAGEPFTAGHPLFANRRARTTASAVQRLLAAGADFVGMTCTDSGGFGMTTDAVANPRFPNLTVGGSAGGAAAAVAGHLADLGLGTDSCGSIRVPAACTGLFGFKPSFGRVALDGVAALAPNFDHAGLLARDLDILARAAAVLLQDASLMEADPESAPLTVAADTRHPSFADPAIIAGFEASLARLRAAGFDVIDVGLPDREVLTTVFGRMLAREAALLHVSLSREDRRKLGPAARKVLSTPLADATEIDACHARLAIAQAAYERCLDGIDVILSPTLFITPPPRRVQTLRYQGRRHAVIDLFLAGTCFCNLTGGPAVTLPLEGDPPFSLHIAGGLGRDDTVLQAARRICDILGARPA